MSYSESPDAKKPCKGILKSSSFDKHSISCPTLPGYVFAFTKVLNDSSNKYVSHYSLSEVAA